MAMPCNVIWLPLQFIRDLKGCVGRWQRLMMAWGESIPVKHFDKPPTGGWGNEKENCYNLLRKIRLKLMDRNHNNVCHHCGNLRRIWLMMMWNILRSSFKCIRSNNRFKRKHKNLIVSSILSRHWIVAGSRNPSALVTRNPPLYTANTMAIHGVRM